MKLNSSKWLWTAVLLVSMGCVACNKNVPPPPPPPPPAPAATSAPAPSGMSPGSGGAAKNPSIASAVY